ncbi:amidohydrolase [Pelobium manganitolerans]|uniref:Amidohydrolase n=1 Tax=Pelobium manganitolerans TaxID=1842495 RepID=A0A419S1I8_9SPHI|nr:amidohydrolase family protein [Pelobium manganitolerans]RKD12349.1 amidohydrolase [Pelobium manganitolerans]
MRRFSADLVYTLEGEPIPRGIVITDDHGKILQITQEQVAFDPAIERYEGVIVPGFINVHCHLELSHMKGQIPEKTGLIPFIKSVVKTRGATEEQVLEAMQQADEEMWNNGIVAVGDISNQTISAPIKAKSKIKYHTFIEMLGLDAGKAAEVLSQAVQKKAAFQTPTSITVHAPYSVSIELVHHLKAYCKGIDNKIAWHNQECIEEDELYKTRSGQFLQFYEDLGIDATTFASKSKSTLQALLPFMPKKQHILLVHNTYTCLKDVYFTKRFEKPVFWCFCPKANLYIEDKLPPFDFFKHSELLKTIGTDSLASNNTLSILEEMKVLQQHIPDMSLTELLKWACINGAKYLGYDADLGSIAIGKTPGLNLLQRLQNEKIGESTTVKKLI